MAEQQLPKIGLPTWREDAIYRVVGMYDDMGESDEALVKVKRNATDIERFSALIELLDEVYPEAASLVRSSKASPKTRLEVVIGRLNEVSLEGREFAAINATTYDWRDVEAPAKHAAANGGRKTTAKTRGERTQAPKVDDEFVKRVVKETAPKTQAKIKTTTRKPASTTAAKTAKRTPTRATKITTRTRTK